LRPESDGPDVFQSLTEDTLYEQTTHIRNVSAASLIISLISLSTQQHEN
jgi:hypothetical protein